MIKFESYLVNSNNNNKEKNNRKLDELYTYNPMTTLFWFEERSLKWLASLAQLFSGKFCENIKNTFFYRISLMPSSGKIQNSKLPI